MEIDEEEDPVALFMSLDDWQDCSSQSSTETFMVGFVIANIVGLRYYSGTITGRELVGLVREPLNVYDQNAIKVLNTRSLQVGHIERSVASVLSPLIDTRKITVEGIVANSRSRGNKFRIPCQIHIFARFDDFETVKSTISRGGLVLISEMDVSFGLSEAMVVKEKNKKSQLKSLDEIFKLVDDNVNKKGKIGALEPPKEVIKSELFVHQKEGLWWLMNRENSGELPPFWEEKDGEFVNVLTNYHTDKRPEPLRGGILADDMGLGKTLTLLSLIAFDKVDSNATIDRDNVGEVICEMDEGSIVSSGNNGKRGRVSTKGAGGQKKHRTENTLVDSNVKGKSLCVTDNSSKVLGSKGTLIVCPPAVFSTWITQLEEHTQRGSFKVYMYYGERTKEAEELKKQDIVLTTYSTLASEDSWEDSPMKMIEWWRVILDEAHVIKNANAQQSRTVTNLKAKQRWVVTGTPIQNGSYDLFSLMAFLRFEPFSIKNYWQSLVQRPLAQGDKKGLSRLQQEIKQWCEERRKNYPSKANINKKCSERQTNSGFSKKEAIQCREQLKEILAKQAELGVEVAEIPSHYLSDSEKQVNERENDKRSVARKGRSQNKHDRKGRYNKNDGFGKQQKLVHRDSSSISSFHKRKPTLLQKLLSADVRRDKKHLLQAFRFMVNNSLFEDWPEKSLKFPHVVVKEDEREDVVIAEKSSLVGKDVSEVSNKTSAKNCGQAGDKDEEEDNSRGNDGNKHD